MLHTLLSIPIERAQHIEMSILSLLRPGGTIPEFLSLAFSRIPEFTKSVPERDYAMIFIGAQLEKNNHLHNYDVLFGKKKRINAEDPVS